MKNISHVGEKQYIPQDEEVEDLTQGKNIAGKWLIEILDLPQNFQVEDIDDLTSDASIYFQTSIVSITKRRSLFSRFWEITQVVKLARNDTRLTKPNR
jgi:hypothetical protein